MDKLTFEFIKPYQTGETWARDFHAVDAIGTKVLINGRDIVDLFGTSHSHSAPHAIYYELSTALQKKNDDYPYAMIGGCLSCGDDGCDPLCATVTDEGDCIRWKVSDHQVSRALFFEFDKKEYADALATLQAFVEQNEASNRNRKLHEHVFDFVESQAIVDYWQKTNFQPDTLQMAYLIWHSKNATIEQRHSAYKSLIMHTEDCSISERCNMKTAPSLHKYLEKLMCLQHELIVEFYDNADAVYTGGLVGERPYDVTFESVDAALFEVQGWLCGANKHAFVTKHSCNGARNITVVYNAHEERLDVSLEHFDKTPEERELLDAFYGLWLSFPLPFKRGDIVISHSSPYANGGNLEMLVVDRIACWDKTEAEENGIRTDAHFEKQLDFFVKKADGLDMTTQGYFVRDDGSIYYECMHDFLDMDYPTTPITGKNKTLVALSNFIKGKLSVDELLYAYDRLLQENRLQSTIDNATFTKEGLALMGLAEDVKEP